MPIMREMTVRRDALDEVAIDETVVPVPVPDEGEVLLEVEAFALTANNVTYGVVGEQLKYWDFFPAPEGWGHVPVWGHARVVASECPEISVGERVYGYMPMATHLIVRPGKDSAGMFRDMAAHRQPMAVVYNQYKRLAGDPAHDPEREEARMLFEPLFLTSFLIEDQLRRADWFGAGTLVVTSASSKTALGLAHVVRAASPGVVRVGLTSAGNLAFVEGTGLYDQVVSYDAIGGLEIEGTALVVDFAGNGRVLSDLAGRLGARLAYVLKVGVTHHDEASEQAVTGPKPVWFFAPDAAAALIGEIGADGFQRAVAARWAGFVGEAEGWVTVERGQGGEAIAAVWRALVAGRARPDVGYIMRW